MNLNKALIAPIVVMVLFYLKIIFGIELPDETTDITVNGIWAIVSLVSTFWVATQPPTKPPKGGDGGTSE